MPSTKVLTQLAVGVVLAVAAYLAQDMTWAEGLPGWLAPIVAQLLAAVAAYGKAETNPAPSSFERRP